jgi:hypothetical protein
MNLDKAAAVVRELGIEQSIREKIDLLYTRLINEEAEAIGRSDGVKLPILASLLTTVNVFINYASSRRNLEAAFALLRREFGVYSHEEQVPLLGTMTLCYIADAGLRLHAGDAEKVEGWTRLQKYVAEVEAEVLAAV